MPTRYRSIAGSAFAKIAPFWGPVNPLAVRTNAATPAALSAVSSVSLYLIPR